jgi:GTP cyclohydrolase II
LDAIVEKGWGVLVYLRQEGRGIGLHAKIQAYHLQDEGADTLDANLMLGLPADGRTYTVAGEILNGLGIESVDLLTNNPEKVTQLEQQGINVAKRTPLIAGVTEQNRTYLATKRERMGHLIDKDDL